MVNIVNSRKYIFICIGLALLLCIAQAMGSTLFVLGLLALLLALTGWCCCKNFTLPILLFFLPWSPILRLSPTSYSFYTFAMVLVCVVSIIKTRFSFRPYQIIAGLVLLSLTLLSKLLDESTLTFDYIAFVMMIVLFPSVRRETRKGNYDFYQAVLFFSLGIIAASLCALYFENFANIRKFITVASYSTIIRRSGFYGDANFYVAQVLAAFAGVLTLTLCELNRQKKILLGVIAMFLLYCGFLSGSKSFAIIATVSAALWTVAVLRARGRAGLKMIFLVGLSAVIVFVTTSTLFQGLIEVIVTRFSSADDLDSLTTGRIGLWESYIGEIVGNVKVFFLGRGFTNIKVNGRGSHNTILQMFYQFGLLGTPILVYWIGCFYKPDYKITKNTSKFDLKAWIIAIGAFAPWMAIDALFFDEFFLLQAYVYMALQNFAQNPLENPKPDKPPVDLAALKDATGETE